eukprot:CAMPEP_0173216858 /NCGR_PEP_ID=MMETSP1142-20121109/155_1 /TAXON_ID=483371 /ORGANISM="non described non described, Strain CCMP2298" /LENGTH=464 /DNA_ID=CAMNT_0014144337 /DNA_START=18 /DNA_END=1409 /DNA_ORIENTATION=+
MKGYKRPSRCSSGYPPYFHLLEVVHNAIHAAVVDVCGPQYTVALECGGSIVKPYPRWPCSGDFQSSCAAAIFRKHLVLRAKQSASDGSTSPSVTEVMEVVTHSAYGLRRNRVYNSGADVAEAIVESCKADDNFSSSIFDVRTVGSRGLIVVITRSHLDWQLASGKVLCAACGDFFQSGRPARMHTVLEHNVEYGDAQAAVREMDYRVVVYRPSAAFASQEDQQPVDAAHQDGDEIPLCVGLDACRRGDLQLLAAMVEQRAFDPITTLDRNGCDGLCWAAGNGHLSLCRYLHDVGMPALLRGKLKRKRHPLHWAARNGHIPVLDWFVHTLEVDVDIGTEDGTTALHYAVWSGHFDAVQWLVERGGCGVGRMNSYGCNASQWCALNGNISILQYLHSRGLAVDVKNNNGHSALHKAAMKGQREICEWLLLGGGGGLGLSHMQPDRDGYSPALFAVHNGFVGLSEWL